MSRISDAFEDGPAFIPYLAAGDPTFTDSLEYVRALERGGSDVIELGLPFSEPIAEGPTIQAAVRRSLDAGMTPTRFFDFVDSLNARVPLVCMTYYNLVYQYGSQSGPGPFIEQAADVGIDGIIVPDLPVEESGPILTACRANNLDLIYIVAPTTRGERLARIMADVSGYVYVQARLGTTGARTSVSEQTVDSLSRLREWSIPKAVGFGISKPEHASAIIEAGADGIIVGSALVDIVADSTSPETATDHLEATVRELKQGALDGAVGRHGPERT